MKILLTSDHPPKNVNGVVISVMNLMNELRTHGEDVRLLCLSSTSKSYVEDGIYHIGSMPFNIYPDVRARLNTHHPLVNELIEWKPDIIHSHCEFFTYGFVDRIARKCNCPIIHTYHTMYEHYVRYVLPVKGSSKLVAPVMRYRLRTADVVIAPTRKVRDSLFEGGISEDVRIIPTGIDLKKYDVRLQPEERQDIFERLALPSDAILIGSVGRLAKEKNYSEILRVFQHLKKDYPNLYLVLTGDGAYREQLEKEVDEYDLRDRVRFAGMIPAKNIYAYYQILTLFLSASVSETQGLTYIEALANGLPVIARRDPAIEGVVRNGYNGYQYETTQELEERIRQLLDDTQLRSTLQEGARESRDDFGTERFGERVLQLYREVLARETPHRLQTTRPVFRFIRSAQLRGEQSDLGRWIQRLQSLTGREKLKKETDED